MQCCRSKEWKILSKTNKMCALRDCLLVLMVVVEKIYLIVHKRFLAQLNTPSLAKMAHVWTMLISIAENQTQEF
jgi:hypothetical protein